MPTYTTSNSKGSRVRTFYERDEDGYEYPASPGQEVIIEDDAPLKTGLVDLYGNAIYRMRERVKMGFHFT